MLPFLLIRKWQDSILTTKYDLVFKNQNSFELFITNDYTLAEV